jgi:hypothetical protein
MAKLLFVSAADSHEKADAYASASLALVKAAEVSKMSGDIVECATLLKRAAEDWGMNGDVSKCAEYFLKAAKETESISASDAKSLYNRACALSWPPATPKERVAMLPPIVIDIYRDTFIFYLRNDLLDDAIAHTSKLVDLYEALQIQSSLFKILFAVTILLLAKGDVVRADQLYMQDHLNNSQYITSRECALAEDFIMAFKNYDTERLASAQASSTMHFMDREVVEYARKLSLLTVKTQDERVLKKLSQQMDSMRGISSVAVVSGGQSDDPFDDNGNLVDRGTEAPPTMGQSTYHDTGDDEIDLT